MIKGIYRLVIILAVFALVGAGIHGLVNSSAGQAVLAQGRGGFQPDVLSGAAFAQPSVQQASFGGVVRTDFGGDRGFDRGGGSGSLAGIATNLGEVALVTALVVAVQKSFKHIRRRTV